jgi:hypothetical protein
MWWVWGRKVTRRLLALLLLAVAIPATAQTFGAIGANGPACLVVGGTTFRMAAPGARAHITVRIDSSALAPDMRIQLSDTPDDADLILVDDGGQAPSDCGAGTTVRHVRIDPEAIAPDVTIGFSGPSAPADYRIYVRSRELEPMTAAALLAASRTAARKVTASK